MTVTPSRSYPWYGEGLVSQPAPLTDLWVGGPGATGRGLPAACGGVGPALATIVSPSEDPGPGGQFRFLQRTHHQTWSPSTPLYAGKKAGDLLATGGRRRVGSAWSYFDENGVPLGTVDWRGPLPGGFGPSTNITNTVRRGVTDSGFTPSDATGGVVQSYSRRVDAAEGVGGSGTSVDPAETWSLANGSQVIWDSILEFPLSSINNTYTPRFGIHDGSTFPYSTFKYTYSGSTNQFTPQPPGSPNGATWYGVAIDYGPGPNGGRLWRFVTSCIVPAAVPAAAALAFLFQSDAGSPPARSVYIHNHVAYRLTLNQGRIYGPLPFTMVAAGQTPVLADEVITFPGKFEDSTVVARADLRNRPLDFAGGRIFALGQDDALSPLLLSEAQLARWSPWAVYGTVTSDVLTLAVTTDGSRVQKAYANGALVGSPAAPADAPSVQTTSLRVGRFTSGDKFSPLVPIRRLQVYPRALTGAEVTAVHQRIVAAES